MSRFLDNLIRKKQQEIQRLVELNNEEGNEGEGQAAAAASLSAKRKSFRSLLFLH